MGTRRRCLWRTPSIGQRFQQHRNQHELNWLWYSLAFSFWSHPVDLSYPEADIAETHTDKDITIIKTTAHTTKTNSTREPDILMISLAKWLNWNKLSRNTK